MSSLPENIKPRHSVRADSLLSALHSLTLIYLSIPILIFCLGWLRPIYGWSLAVFLTAALVGHLWTRRSARRAEGSLPRRTLHVAELIGVCGLIGLLVAISGVGGYGSEHADWLKHNAILRDLIESQWPVHYQFPFGAPGLVYCLAYYLPAASVGKVFGWEAANDTLFLFTLAGCILSVLWLCGLCRTRPWKVALVFALFSGMDFLAMTIRIVAQGKAFGLGEFLDVEWWSGHWEYSSNVTLLLWAPQHALIGWLVAALLLGQRLNKAASSATPFLLAIAALWSPFVFVGALPFAILEAGQTLREKGSIRAYLTSLNAVGMFIGVVMFFFYASHFIKSPVLEAVPGPKIAQDEFNVPLLHGNLRDKSVLLAVQLAFCALEIGFLALTMHLASPFSKRRARDWLVVALLTLGILPFFRYGHYNDLVMRASIPALFLVCYFLIETLPELDFSGKRFPAVSLTVIFAIGALTPLDAIRHQVGEVVARSQLRSIPEKATLPTLEEIQAIYRYDFLRQYLGEPDSFFFRHLARPVEGDSSNLKTKQTSRGEL